MSRFITYSCIVMVIALSACNGNKNGGEAQQEYRNNTENINTSFPSDSIRAVGDTTMIDSLGND